MSVETIELPSTDLVQFKIPGVLRKPILLTHSSKIEGEFLTSIAILGSGAAADDMVDIAKTLLERMGGLSGKIEMTPKKTLIIDPEISLLQVVEALDKAQLLGNHMHREAKQELLEALVEHKKLPVEVLEERGVVRGQG